MNQNSFIHLYTLSSIHLLKKKQSLAIKLFRDVKTEALKNFGLPKFSQWVNMRIQTFSVWSHIFSTILWGQVTKIFVSTAIYIEAYLTISRWQDKKELNLLFLHIQSFWKMLCVPATFPTVSEGKCCSLQFSW